MSPLIGQYAAIALAVVGILTWVRWAQGNGRIKLYAIAPISWLVHVIIFYGARSIFNPASVPSRFFLEWGIAVSLHGVILMIAGALIMLDYARQKAAR